MRMRRAALRRTNESRRGLRAEFGCAVLGDAVVRLFPEERIAQQLIQRLVGGNRRQHPVAEYSEAIGNELEPAAMDRGEHGQINERTVAGQEIEQGEEQQDRREEHVKTSHARYPAAQI